MSAGQAFAWHEPGLGAEMVSQWHGLPALRAAWIGNVAGGRVAAEVSGFLSTRCPQDQQHWVQSAVSLGGISSRYRDPARLGVDRLLAMVAAYDRYRQAVCVADCGTALTVDLVDAAGEFRGGVIAPGPALMRAALGRGTRQLPIVEADAGAALALDTESAIAAGCARAAAGAVVLAYQEFSTTIGFQPKCILTGGDAPGLLPMLAMACDHDPDLVLRGLAVLAVNAS